MSVLRLTAAFVLMLAAVTATAGENYTVSVATDGYNRFTFDTSFDAIVLPPDAPVASDPVALGANTTLLLEFEPDLDHDVQMVVQMKNGKVFDLTLKPDSDHTAAWKQPTGPSGDTPIQRPEDNMLVTLFQEALADPSRAPDGFNRIDTPAAQTMADGSLTADYIAAYQSDRHRLYVMRLRADKPSPIVPQDLYIRGVQAVYVGGDAVGPEVAPIALVLARKSQER